MFKPLPPADFHRCVRASLAGVMAACLVLAPAAAETPLPALGGQWQGTGTDRDSPFQAAQWTQCRTRVWADPTRLSSDMQCKGRRGLDKRILLTVAFTGDRFTGTVRQTSVVRGTGASPLVRAGAVVGTRKGDIADFAVRFPGLTPNAYVRLELRSPTSFAMTVSSLGATLTKVEFRRSPVRERGLR